MMALTEDQLVCFFRLLKKIYDSVSDVLFSKKNYNILDDNVKNHESNNYCNLFSTFEYKYKGIKDLCQKIAKNLKELPSLNNVGKTYRDRCSYMNYWAYNEILKKYQSNFVVIDRDLADKLFDVVFNINKDHLSLDYRCYIPFEGDFFKWKNLKILHDYFRNVDEIESNIDSIEKDKCEEYDKYIQLIKPIYDIYAGKCCTWEDECPFFLCDYKYDHHVILHKLKKRCNGTSYSRTPDSDTKRKIRHEEDNSDYITLPNLQLLGAKHEATVKAKSTKKYIYANVDETKTPTTYKYLRCRKWFINKGEKDDDLSTFARCYETPVRQESFDKVFISSAIKNQRDTIILDLKSTDFDSTIRDASDMLETPNHISKTITFRIGASIVLFLGIAMVFFIYFKVNKNSYRNFTPLGSWIKNRTRKNKTVKKNHKVQRRNLPPNTSPRRANANIPNKTIRIMYDS
ncbi:variable surface protein [Plasmodium gonderi]|uniref:Variable surface protein n=1 Tax=Plasmodium gonderi TaxID=77519 RepID=A0A1Y1JU99_PLAGO|nr:variable surface protein [Plasmodium gonderi]GAW84322.1 variable surface protein [Plasmodium gonderi]